MSTVPRTSHAAILAPALLAASLLASAPASAHEGPGSIKLERLGKVDFKVDCNAAAQQEFNRGVALNHSFAWKQALDSFAAVAKADPTCGMAHWGRAVTLLDNPFVWPANLPAKLLDEITEALAAARTAGLKSQREKDYVEAIATFLRDRDKLNHRTRLAAYDAAMSKLAATYKDDKEASILSALVTSANFDPADKTYANQLKAAKILEPLFASQPDHPGVAHYLIHSYDYPPIAKHGLEAARRYAKIAPDAPHALHMPSHIFTRVGSWKDSIEANRASSKAAGEATFDGHHAHDYMVYAHLQLAQDRAARKAMLESQAKKPVEHFGSAYAYAAMPARLALESGDWKAAAIVPLTPAPKDYAWKRFPQAEAVNAFARGVGAARSGNAVAARAEQARLVGLREAAKELKLTYWADQIDIQAEVVNGLATIAEGKAPEGLVLLKAAADREDATEKHAVTPGPLLPAREIVAETLLERGTGAEALAAFEAVLTREPNRYRAYLGAGRAARKAGDLGKARKYAAALVALGATADMPRLGLQQARQLLAQR